MANEDTLDLGGGTIINKSDKTYQALLAKGYTDQQMIDTYKKIQQNKPTYQTQPIDDGKVKKDQNIIESNKKLTDNKLNTPKTQVEQPGIIQLDAQEKKAEPNTTSDVKPTENTPKLLPVSDYMDDSEARQMNIIANLNNARINNPESLKNQTEFRNYYNYAGRSELQKKTLDNWYKGYKKGQELSLKTSNDIFKMYDTGSLTETDLDNLRLTNESKYNEAMELIDKKNKLNTYSEDLYGITTTANPFQSIIDNYIKNLKNFSTSPSIYQEYKDAMNSDTIKQYKLDIADKETELNQLDLQIANKKSEIKKRFEGTGATKGKIMAIYADEVEELQNLRSNLVIDMNGIINKYNSEAGTIRDNFELQLQEQQYNNQQRQQQMSELGFAMNLMNYQTPQQQDERAWQNFIRQQEYVDGNIYSNDPATRRRAVSKAVDGVLAEFAGIPMVRSREQMIEDIQKMVDSGTSLGDAITENIRKPIKEKKEYQIWSANKLGISGDALNLAGMNLKWNDTTNSRNFEQPLPEGYVDVPRNVNGYTNNVGVDTNNPGNITDKAGTAGKYKSPNGRTYAVYNTVEEGYQALLSDIKAKQTGNTGTGLNGDSTVSQLLGVWVNGKGSISSGNYYNAFIKASGLSGNTKIGSVDASRIARGIMAGEGTLKMYESGGVDLSGLGATSTNLNTPTVIDSSLLDAVGVFNFTSDKNKELFVGQIEKYLSEGKTDLAKSAILNRYKSQLGVTESAGFDMSINAYKGLEKLEQMIDDGTVTGYLKGNLEKTLNKIGDSTDPKLTEFKVYASDILDIIRRKRSGAALTEFEERFYNGIFPSLDKGVELNKQLITSMKSRTRESLSQPLELFFTTDIYRTQIEPYIFGGTAQSNTLTQPNRFRQWESPLTGVGTTIQYQTPINFNSIPRKF